MTSLQHGPLQLYLAVCVVVFMEILYNNSLFCWLHMQNCGTIILVVVVVVVVVVVMVYLAVCIVNKIIFTMLLCHEISYIENVLKRPNVPLKSSLLTQISHLCPYNYISL